MVLNYLIKIFIIFFFVKKYIWSHIVFTDILQDEDIAGPLTFFALHKNVIYESC